MNLSSVTDKDLMVYLVAIGFQIKNIEKDGNRSIAYFEKNSEYDDALIRFVNKSDKVNIADYAAAEKRVKTLLCQQKADKS